MAAQYNILRIIQNKLPHQKYEEREMYNDTIEP